MDTIRSISSSLKRKCEGLNLMSSLGGAKKPKAEVNPCNQDQEESCGICFQSPIDCATQPDACSHATFCQDCLVTWSKVSPVCPVCRVTFKRMIYVPEDGSGKQEISVGKQTLAYFLEESDTEDMLIFDDSDCDDEDIFGESEEEQEDAEDSDATIELSREEEPVDKSETSSDESESSGDETDDDDDPVYVPPEEEKQDPDYNPRRRMVRRRNLLGRRSRITTRRRSMAWLRINH